MGTLKVKLKKPSPTGYMGICALCVSVGVGCLYGAGYGWLLFAAYLALVTVVRAVRGSAKKEEEA